MSFRLAVLICLAVAVSPVDDFEFCLSEIRLHDSF